MSLNSGSDWSSTPRIKDRRADKEERSVGGEPYGYLFKKEIVTAFLRVSYIPQKLLLQIPQERVRIIRLCPTPPQGSAESGWEVTSLSEWNRESYSKLESNHALSKNERLHVLYSFVKECVLAPIGTPIRVIRLLRTSGPASPSDRLEERKGFLQAGKLELFLPCYFSIPDLAGFEADANNALAAAGRFRFHSNTSVCCKGDRSASGDYGPQRKIRSVLQTALSHTEEI
ncbi:hypothetical protein SDJN03_15855, partial [Cucurbita argyrosperma subsp. sororia]